MPPTDLNGDPSMKLAKFGLDDALDELRRRKQWTMHFFPNPREPVLIAAVHRWQHFTDVLLLWSEDKATTYRTPNEQDRDPLAPETVSYVYSASAEWTLRVALTLDDPRTGVVPCVPMPTPPACVIPANLYRPRTIRPPMGTR
jgi:hypothetical protein